MKKTVLLVVLLLLAGLLAYRLISHKTSAVVDAKPQPLRISKNSPVFNTAFAGLLHNYYALRDALVSWDTTRADLQADSVTKMAVRLPFEELKGDSSLILTAKSLAAMLGNESLGLAGERSIEEKRRAFNMLTDAMYNLVRTVRYDGQIIYHVRCPMAFNDSEEGFWLTNTSQIVNPYFGSKHPHYGAKMLTCGEVTDSMDFSK